MLKHVIPMMLLLTALLAFTAGCDDEDDVKIARVSIHNDFDNDEFERKPPWTICKAHYQGTDWETPITLGETSEEKEVEAGLGYVYMVLAWDDPTCAPEHCLPVASKNEEETVDGQTRTIDLNVPNHQGPCPPEGVEPIPQELYDTIVDLWPEYGFEPYETRTDNPQCQD